MKTRIPPWARLSPAEVEGLRRLRPAARAEILPELVEPGSRSTVRRILLSKDPERALVDQIARETVEAIEAVRRAQSAGLSGYDEAIFYEGLGSLKKKFKKVVKKVQAVAKKVVKPVVKITKKAVAIHKTIAKKAVQLPKKHIQAVKKIGKKIMPILKQYAPVIIGVVGAVLAPFTGGASLAAAAVLSAGYQIARQRKEAKKLERANKKEAAQINAEVAAQERQVKADLDKLYAENTAVFISAGITRADWDRLSIEQKLAVIEKINRGEMPAAPDAVEAAAQQQGVPTPGYVENWNDDWMRSAQSSPISQAFADASGTSPDAPGGGDPGGEAPAGQYELWVEGEKVAEGASLDDLAIEENTKPGDRFTVSLNGKPLGLKIRTEGGAIPVPADQVQRVLAMSKEEVEAMIARATQVAGGEEPVASKGGGFPTWILLPVAAVAIAAAS